MQDTAVITGLMYELTDGLNAGIRSGRNVHDRPSHHGSPSHAQSRHQRVSEEEVATAVASASQTMADHVVHDPLPGQLRGERYLGAAQAHHAVRACWSLCQCALLVVSTPATIHATALSTPKKSS